MQRGRFITFEGGEGVGKSTQARLLAARLRQAGIDPVLTREPGGSPFAERLRELLLEPAFAPASALAEALAFHAARADHIAQLIQPKLSAGCWVISDRYSDSTRAYQGAAGGVAESVLDTLEALVTRDARPDLTLLLDLDADRGLARARARAQSATEARPSTADGDAFETRQREFHERLRQGFLAIAAAETQRVAVIDADAPPAVVGAAVWRVVAAHCGIG